MNPVVKVLVVIFIFSGGSSVHSAENSSQLNALSNISITDVLSSVNLTTEGIFDFDGMIQKLNLTGSVNTTSILSRLNVSSEGGLVDLKGLVQTFNLTNVRLENVLGLLNVNITNGVLDFTNLVQAINSSGGLTEYLNSAKVNASEDASLDFTGLAKKYIGTVEEHNVTTDDGHILKVFHIPGNTSKVILFSHGLLCSSDDFILKGKTSLVYMVAQRGYDVWVMNYRGNRYSRNHTTLDPNTDEFWKFSMQHFGYYDLSAVIDYILDKTGQQKLSLVGHSEGTAAAFVLTSTRTEYNDKIKVFVALSPVCYISDSGLAMKALLRTALNLRDTLKAFGFQELLGFQTNGRKLVQLMCSQGKVGYDLCVRGPLGALSGYYPENFEQEFFNVVLGHYPAGTSLENFWHYGQILENNIFSQYDYGSKNKDIYGSETPPLYDFKKVTSNVVLFGAKNDNVLGLKDFARVKNGLENVKSYVVNDDFFSHFDFVYGLNADVIVYPKIIEELNAYNK